MTYQLQLCHITFIIVGAERSAEDGGQKYLQGTWKRDLQGTGYINVYTKQEKLIYRGVRIERIGYREAYKGFGNRNLLRPIHI